MPSIEFQRSKGVVTITICRPHRKNALDIDVFLQLRDAALEVGTNADDRVVVVTGSGADFCTGADLTLIPNSDSHPLDIMRKVGAACSAMRGIPLPVIAKVRGHAVGAGANLALGCDFVLASETASFCQIFVRRGFSIDFGGSYDLPRLIGTRRAKELALLGDDVGAARALELGLVNRVVAEDNLDDAVAQLVEQLLAAAPLGLSATKGLLDVSFSHSLSEALEAESTAQAMNFSSQDTREGIAAFLERRQPTFVGR